MEDEDLLRYSRQIMLPAVDVAGQERLLAGRVLLVGLGGLGSTVAMYLAAAGVGHLTLVDFDRVDLTNLQRQVIHRTADIGRPKVESARDTLLALNPGVRVEPVDRRLNDAELLAAVQASDVVVDATDNFAIRFALNRACLKARRPLVSGAAIRMEGQVSVFRNDRPEAPCYHCLYKDEGELGETCTQSGVLAPIPAIIGSIQATEALKLLLGLGEGLEGRLLMLDAATMSWRTLRLRKDPRCTECGHGLGRG